ncbi:metalloregulator ArsR/SmtB family transcription factor (plasmid) [Deinococcus radiomollis]|uniref:ArsR/SmtB family transcription factor n=1 Tax=Deinococcus radiomollis TaxID=468916 RepID=UPI0038918D6A
MQQHPVPEVPDGDDLTRVAEIFKTLSEPIRVQLVLLLTQGERSVAALVEALGQPQSTVSRHLGLLRSAQVVKTRREATHVYYRLADTHVAQLVQQAFSHTQHERLGLPDHTIPDPLIGSVH